MCRYFCLYLDIVFSSFILFILRWKEPFFLFVYFSNLNRSIQPRTYLIHVYCILMRNDGWTEIFSHSCVARRRVRLCQKLFMMSLIMGKESVTRFSRRRGGTDRICCYCWRTRFFFGSDEHGAARGRFTSRRMLLYASGSSLRRRAGTQFLVQYIFVRYK